MRNLSNNSKDCRNIKGDGKLDGEETWHLEPSILQQLRHGKWQTGTLQPYPQQELLLQKSAEPLETDQASTESAVTVEQRRVHKLELQGCMKDWAFNYKLFTLQEGIILFNQKPARVVKFLLSTIGLNKGLIGDYLGEKEEFSFMHAYVDSNCHNMEFDMSIRTFLMGFSLPGDQKINRTMENLQSDIAPMSKAAFIKTNGGIDNGKDLPEEFMGGLYDRIVNKEIKMKADNVIPVTNPAGKDNNLLLGLTTS
ncbi:hypothetical protein SELMODRAFT_431551 [Selaginella moellendorffii]|uniref:SEC7 domain-containing protein n=1 Tax=Selaginella moellendorffii TaxID=88036 RepID=D8TD12_SELML|nr:hypothetical protein SELMODRAFT_431551 [Selaginella moellendorffii]